MYIGKSKWILSEYNMFSKFGKLSSKLLNPSNPLGNETNETKMSADPAAYRPTSSWNKTPQQEHGKCKDHRVPMKPPFCQCRSWESENTQKGLPPRPPHSPTGKQGLIKGIIKVLVLLRGLLRDQLMRKKTTEQIPFFHLFPLFRLAFGRVVTLGCHEMNIQIFQFLWGTRPGSVLGLLKQAPRKVPVQVNLFWDVRASLILQVRVYKQRAPLNNSSASLTH